MHPEITRRLAAHRQAELARDMTVIRNAGLAGADGQPPARRARRMLAWLRVARSGSAPGGTGAAEPAA
jgi:hypothetical protein